MTKLLAALILAILAAGCGGSHDQTDAAVSFAGKMRATGLPVATQSAPTAVTADMTLDWAEYKFPDLFPKAIGVRFPAIVYEGVTYNARVYVGVWGERYLGITPDGRIFGLGDFTAGALQQFDDVSHWSAQVLADKCSVNPDSCVNLPPVANAGTAQNVVTGTVVTLNGSSSSDANGDQLTYSWSLTSRPAGSAAVLVGTTSARPTFFADVAGNYVARLVVNDGKVDSTAATVTVTATQPPASNVYPVTVSRVDNNIYFSSSSKLLILTKFCYEYIYSDKAVLTMTGSTGYFDGTIRFSNGKTCDVGGAYWPSALTAGNYTATLTLEEFNIYSDSHSSSIIWTQHCYEYRYFDQAALRLAYSTGTAYSAGSVIGTVTFSGGRSCDLIGIFSLARLN